MTSPEELSQKQLQPCFSKVGLGLRARGWVAELELQQHQLVVPQTSSEEGVVSRVGHVETTTAFVETTPANKAKRSVIWVISEGATRGRASGSEESGPQLVDGGKGE